MITVLSFYMLLTQIQFELIHTKTLKRIFKVLGATAPSEIYIETELGTINLE